MSPSNMHEQRSWQFSLVVSCSLSCVIFGMIVVLNQSSIAIRTLSSGLKDYERRIAILEIQNINLLMVLDKIQRDLNTTEKQTNVPTDISSMSSTSELSHKSTVQGKFDVKVIGEGNTKGDDGVSIESDSLSKLETTIPDDADDLQVRRNFRSTRRQRNGEGRKECKRCKGEKGDTGPVSYVGEQGQKGIQGQKGERGHKGRVGERGPAGKCEHYITTDSTPTLNTQPQYPIILAAHFDGDIDSPAIITRRDPINRGYVDLSEIDGGWVPYWKYADWMDEDTQSKFHLNYSTGNVTVTDGGIYYVYSQMLYYDPSVFMGHSLYIGDQKRFSCTECTVDRDRKFNTCYIGGVVQINPGDKVGVKVSYANRIINLHPDSTHFGLIKLS